MALSYEDYTRRDALGLAELVRKKEASADDLLDAALARLEAVNPKINALAHRFEHLARAQIKAGLPEGPFTGVPFMTKDLNVMVEGAPLTNGSRAWLGNVSKEDGTLAKRFKRAGLAIFGSTTSPELGLTTTTENNLTGKTSNPWAPGRIAGGSSGGAAAVVSAGVLPLAQASDGGGSIRIPAAMCGVFGLKPSRARVPMGPRVTDGWLGMSTVFAVSRSVRDSAALLDAVEGAEPGMRVGAAPTLPNGFLDYLDTPPPKLRIAFSTKAPSGVPIDPEVAAAIEGAAKLCERLGHRVEETDLPFLPEAGPAVLTAIAACVARDLDVWEEARGKKFEEGELEIVTAGYRVLGVSRTAKDLAFADLAMQRQALAMARFMESYDLILQPVTAKPPVALGLLGLDDPQRFGREIGAFSPFTAMYNLTGQPSMSVPLHWTNDDLPVGAMFTGRYGEEHTLLRLAAELEEAQPWAGKRPPL